MTGFRLWRCRHESDVVFEYYFANATLHKIREIPTPNKPSSLFEPNAAEFATAELIRSQSSAFRLYNTPLRFRRIVDARLKGHDMVMTVEEGCPHYAPPDPSQKSLMPLT